MQNSERIREVVLRKFERIRARNPGYSMRRYASHLGVSSGALSEVMNRKRLFSVKKVRGFLDSPFFEPQERSELATAAGFTLNPHPSGKPPEYERLSAEKFRVIADWWHFAILNLIQTEGFRPDPKWIASRLALENDLVVDAIFRLKECQLIREENGTYVRTHERVTTSDDQMDLALQRGNLGLIKLAGRKLSSVSVDRRDCTSFVMAINPARLSLAKTAIRRLQDELSSVLEGEDATEVYQLGIQLFPLSTPVTE